MPPIYIEQYYSCAECGALLWNKKTTVHCRNKECKMYNIKLKRPSIEVETCNAPEKNS